jgi:hypothetical protein
MAGPRPEPRRLDFHERDQTVDLGFPSRELGQDTAQTQCFLAELRPHPVVAGGRGVSLVEDEVDDLKHRRQSRCELGRERDLEGDACLGEGPLRSDDPLGDGRPRDEERTRDLMGREPSEQAKRQRDARLGRENGMAGYENEAQQIVADIVVESRIEIRSTHLKLRLDLTTELLVRALEPLASAEEIDRAMLRSCHEPRAGIARNARLGPSLQRGDEGVLGQLLGQADVTHHAHEAGDEFRCLDPPDCLDGAM